MKRPIRSFKISWPHNAAFILVIAAVAAIILFIYCLVTIANINAREKATAKSPEDDILWPIYMAARSAHAIADQYGLLQANYGRASDHMRKIKLEYQINVARLNMLTNSSYRRITKLEEGYQERLDEFAHRLNQLLPSVRSAEISIDRDKDISSAIILLKEPIDLSRSMEPFLVEIANQVNRARVIDISERRVQLLESVSILHRSLIELTMALAVLTCTTGIMGWRYMRQAGQLVYANDKIKVSTRKALAATRAKSTFLAAMGHEIRTPLNGIIGSLELIALDDKPQNLERRIADMRTCSESLRDIVDNVLDFSRIEGGIIDIHAKPTSIRDCIHVCLATIRWRAEANAVSVTPRINGIDWILADGGLIRQVIVNLLSNAIKFSSGGNVALDVQVLENSLRCSVKDCGIGIAESEKPRIFSDFFQGENVAGCQFGGTGLGLSLCKRMVEAMQGEIGFDSQIGVGSTFWFQVPVREAPAAARVTGPATNKQAKQMQRAKPGRVLVAEDNPISRDILTTLLGQMGHSVKAVENGAQAVEAAQSEYFDMILLDTKMPVMDGITAALQIRKGLSQSNQSCIVSLSANAFAEDQKKCLEAGMNDVLSKPVTLGKLKQLFEETIEEKSFDFPEEKAIQSLDEADQADLDLQAVELLIDAVGSDITLRNMLKMLGDAKNFLISYEEAVLSGDEEAMQQLMHSLKGAAGTMGFRNLASQAALAEKTRRNCGEELKSAIQSASLAFSAYLDNRPDIKTVVQQSPQMMG